MNPALAWLTTKIQNLVISGSRRFAPRSRREEWTHKWQSELWYVRRDAPSSAEVWRFCFGAPTDALSIESESSQDVRSMLDSPLRCLTFIAILAGLAFLTSLLLSGTRELLALSCRPQCLFYLLHPHFEVTSFPLDPIDQQLVLLRETLTFAFLVLPAVTTLDIRSGDQLKSFRSFCIRGRWLVFLLLKIAIGIPFVYLSALILSYTGEGGGNLLVQMASSLAGFLLFLRWAAEDQKKRCRVCLRLVGSPVQLGRPSWALLNWNLKEYICPEGHGVLHVPEVSLEGIPAQQWIPLVQTADAPQGQLRRNRLKKGG